ncbi:23S rRNA (adenine1618-N6)-methyltransferase [Formivibrio citricus]|uniref:Ribosomal RNA large subunit methyltransferase F n=1 Tax=Formivibrio citricus TaxID=83765 RepID=A0A1I4VSW7_9NEIS|nr:23S rRNA (adenine(1618)-N(6))-methyltransferase RlmF [Formivibrio citricus]SFN04263.1 23S rRNA (adenine1618-N6)-methyltransferase [Formivibrio citricus]
MPSKKIFPAEKSSLHARNPHRARYDFPALVASHPPLAPFVVVNPYGDESVDFANPAAVKALNRALLAHFYGIRDWDIPDGYLCPPIPGRADYVHSVADLLAISKGGTIPRGDKVRVLDVGVGANAIYPIIGRVAYGWQFVGSEIDAAALKNAETLFARNPALAGGFKGRLQSRTENIFEGVIRPDEHFDLTICNPPFHSSAADAAGGTRRKLRNLGKAAPGKPVLNFGGQSNELWCEGGEIAFVRQMIRESRLFAQQCLWFTTLVSKQDNLPLIYAALERVAPRAVFTLDMAQGQKISRVVAWSFYPQSEHEDWAKQHWR